MTGNTFKQTGTCATKTVSTVVLLLGFSTVFTAGCATKKYVRNQTAPLIQKTNNLDDATAANNRNLQDADERAKSGIGSAQASADSATQNANKVGQDADRAQGSAKDAMTRADSLAGVISNLDSYKPLADVSVNFKFDKADLTSQGKRDLDGLGQQAQNSHNYILEVTGGTDSIGNAQYNYDLSQRRADAVVQYLASKYNIPPRRFYLIGIGKDQAVASNNTPTGRAKNRRVDIRLLSNMSDTPSTGSSQDAPTGISTPPTGPSAQ